MQSRLFGLVHHEIRGGLGTSSMPPHRQARMAYASSRSGCCTCGLPCISDGFCKSPSYHCSCPAHTHMCGRSLQAPPGGSVVAVERIFPFRITEAIITIYRMLRIGHLHRLVCHQVMSPTQIGHSANGEGICRVQGALSPSNGLRQSPPLAHCYPESRADRSLPPLTLGRS